MEAGLKPPSYASCSKQISIFEKPVGHVSSLAPEDLSVKLVRIVDLLVINIILSTFVFPRISKCSLQLLVAAAPGPTMLRSYPSIREQCSLFRYLFLSTSTISIGLAKAWRVDNCSESANYLNIRIYRSILVDKKLLGDDLSCETTVEHADEFIKFSRHAFFIHGSLITKKTISDGSSLTFSTK